MQKQIKSNRSKHLYNLWTWLAFALGVITCCFSRFKFNIFFCAFIFPGCFLFFNRRVKWYIGLPLTLLGLYGGTSFAFFDSFVHYGAMWTCLISLVGALVVFVPYVFDKTIYQHFFEKKHPILLSFMFPLTWLTIDVILGLTPAGTYLSLGYALCQILSATSILSVFGIHFLTFIIVYFSSALAAFLIDIKKNWQSFVTSVSLIFASLTYSGIYQAVPTTSQNVKVMMGYSIWGNTMSESLNIITADVETAKKNNVDILVYTEKVFRVLKGENIETFETEISKLADGIVLLIPFRDDTDDGIKPENKGYNTLWFVADGAVQAKYRKANLFFPKEPSTITPGSGEMVCMNTKIRGMDVKITGVICYDLEFSNYVSQAGRMGADMLFAPSYDNEHFGNYRSDVNAYRAIENGVNFVKDTGNGWSLACDYKGRVYANYFTPNPVPKLPPHFVTLPCKGRWTLYPWLAPFIDYFYPIGLFAVILSAGILNKKKASKKDSI